MQYSYWEGLGRDNASIIGFEDFPYLSLAKLQVWFGPEEEKACQQRRSVDPNVTEGTIFQKRRSCLRPRSSSEGKNLKKRGPSLIEI